MLSEVEMALVWLGCDFVLVVMFSLFARRYVDRNGNGVIDRGELPEFVSDRKLSHVCTRNAEFYDFSLLTIGQVGHSIEHTRRNR